MQAELIIKMKKQVEFVSELLKDNEVVAARAVLEVVTKELEKDLAEYEQYVSNEGL